MTARGWRGCSKCWAECILTNIPQQASPEWGEDFITQFLDYTQGLPTPEAFRLWAGISAVAGALERRVWVETAGSAVYPNLYVLLIAAPGIGKSQAISPIRAVWELGKLGKERLHIAPNSLTKAALLDTIASARCERLVEGGTKQIAYHSLCVASAEFGVLLPEHDLEFLNVLNDIFDNPREFKESRRVSKSVDILAPQMTIIGGTQPGYLANLLPEAAWSMGFMSRIIMIYASEAPQLMDLFDVPVRSPSTSMGVQIKRMMALWGACQWEDEAKVAVMKWYKGGMEPKPQHSKLGNYNSRRLLHLLKLSVISAVSATGLNLIRLLDFQRALHWMQTAEAGMPDVFREMVQRSDKDVIDDLHYFMWKFYMLKKKALHVTMLYHFLQQRIPSEKIDRIIAIAEKSNIIARVAGTTDQYVPRAKGEHGVE